MTDAAAWLDDIDLASSSRWLAMGTRSMADRRWLVADAAREDDLARKRSLTSDCRDEVFAIAPDVDRAVVEAISNELASMVRDASVSAAPIDARRADAAPTHPLERAALSVQEDLCLLQRRPHDGVERWCLDAASVCFPSRWRLADKIGLPMVEVHGPVPGYADELASRVDSLLSALAGRSVDDPRGDAVLRRNWFIHPDGRLFQPDRPERDPVMTTAECLDGLFLRSERQTLRPVCVDGFQPWIVFTIRTQQAPLAEVVADAERAARLRAFLTDAPSDQRRHRGVSDAQLGPLLAAV